jgi:phenylpropionate dioxygenase-like ring-hydroxylating dioxygenase large terminal subunit
MAFLRNAWYAAAWSSEIQNTLFHRVILGEPVVMYRNRRGEAVGFTNLCPHRFAPLHLGSLVEDTIECPYHGLRFDGQGVCVFNPDGEGRVPPGNRLRRYPLIERYATVWIWMGEDPADESVLPDFGFLTDSARYRATTGVIEVPADYRYVLDNLLDAAHVVKVHHDTLASEAITRAKSEVVMKGDAIWVNRWCPNGGLSPILSMMWSMDRGPIAAGQTFDQWANAGWNAPSLVTTDVALTLSGEPMEAGLRTMASHFLTPETETKTHYFWSICRNFKRDDAELDRQTRIGTEYAFIEQDVRMLRAIQEQVADRDFWSLRPMLLHADQGPVRVRRALEALIAAENARKTVTAARAGVKENLHG